MTRDEIENEAYSRLYEAENQWDGIFNSGYFRGFMDGAQWRINSVWHEVSEKPKEHKFILIENNYCGKIIYNVWQAPFPNWEEDVKYSCSLRWAYVDDLLPERKEEI